jgi:hypothetical protein
MVDIHPEGSLYYLYATALFLHAYHSPQSTTQESDARWRGLAKAREVYLRALEAPSILPMRALVLDALIAVELVLGAGDKSKSDSAMLPQAVQHIHERLRQGPLRNGAVASICTVAALEANELALARLLLSDWERLAPNDKSIAYRRAQVEFRSGAYGPAVSAAQQALEHNPKHVEARRLLDEATEKRRAERKAEPP